MRDMLKVTFYFVLVLSSSVFYLGSTLLGQAPRSPAGSRSRYVPSLTFDVASVRESEPVPQPSQYFSNPIRSARLDAANMWVNQLVGDAYGVNFRYQIAGGPDWIGQQRFTIHARSDASADNRLSSLTDEEAKEEKRYMLRHLLQERFGLVCHFEEKPGLTFYLTLSKELLNLRVKPGQSTNSGILSSGVPTDVVLTGRDASIGQLAALMSYYLKAPVVDQTGLKGVYDFKLHFNGHPDTVGDSIDAGPLPEQALSAQLGLKLIRGRGPVHTVVIDAIKKPSAN